MYDTVVIGNDLSSLIAAAIISHHGGKTVLLSEGDNQCVYTESGYTFHIDPLPLTGFGPEQTCSRLLSFLGIQFPESHDPRLLNPSFQIILPNHRIDFFYDEEKLIMDMEREFHGHAEDIRKIYRSASIINDFINLWIKNNPNLYPCHYKDFLLLIKNMPVLMKERLRLAKTFRTIKNSSLLSALVAQITLFSKVSQNSRIQPNILTAYTLSLPFKGVYYHSRGKELLMQSFRSMFINSGGHLINNCSVNNVSINKEININIDTYEKLSTIKGKYLIASTKWEKYGSLLMNDHKLQRLKRKLKSLEVLSHPFSLHMGIHEKGIPQKMATYLAILCNDSYAVMDNNIVFLESSACGEIERAPLGKRALSATVFLKESPMTLSDEELKNISTSIFRSLHYFLPFLTENLDYTNVDKSIELSRKYQGLVSLKYSMHTASFLGLMNSSHSTPRRNVFITGGMLLAGLGFEGEILSGVNAANAIIERGGIKGYG